MIFPFIAFTLLQLQADPNSYTRSVTEPSGLQDMQIRTQRLTAPGKPDIWLVGAVHIGTHAYYSQVQSILNAQDSVLFEGVKPTDDTAIRMKPDPKAPNPIYKVFSDAIGLDFQLNDIDYSHPNWKNVDLSWQKIMTLNKEAANGKPTQVDAISKILDPKSGMAQSFSTMMTAATPGMKEAFKMMMMKVASGAFKSPLDPTTNGIVIEARNKTVLNEIKNEVSGPKPPKSIAVFYGALHLPSMEQALASSYGYKDADKKWLTSATADPNKLDATGKQLLAQLDTMSAPKPKATSPSAP